MVLGKRLRELRLLRGLNQTDIAEIIEVNPSTVSLYESGKRTLSVDKIQILSEYLGVTSDYLLGLTDKPNTKLDIVHVEDLLARGDIKVYMKGVELSETDKKDILHIMNFITRKET